MQPLLLPQTLTLTVPATAKGLRVDAFLVLVSQQAIHAGLASLSRARWQAMIQSQAVTINGGPVRSALRLRGGETLVLHVPAPVPAHVQPVPMPLAILYEDHDMLVLNKPQGLVVHPGSGTHDPTLVHGLLAHCHDLSGVGGVLRPGIVHRLDKGTSGVLVVAKNDASHHSLAKQFAARQVVKHYATVVLGRPRLPNATLETFYGRHKTSRLRFTGQLQQGKLAKTSYRVLQSAGGLSCLFVTLHTGRTHQIRVHLAEAGTPVLGDKLYGGCHWQGIADQWAGFALKAHAQQCLAQALHAYSLALEHPRSGEPMCFVAPVPAHMGALLQALGVTLPAIS